MITIALTLPYPPSANAYWRSFRGRVVVSAEAKEYKRRVRLDAVDVMPIIGPCSVSVRVYRPRAIGDLDNSLKVLLDALRGIAFLDDEQVVRIVAERFDDPRNPGVNVEILGETRATPEQVLEHERAKAATAAKRKATLAAKRLDKSFSAGAPSRRIPRENT